MTLQRISDAARLFVDFCNNYRISKENQVEYLSVEALTEECFESQSKQVCYRKGTKGELWTRIWVREVWTWQPGPEAARKRLLIVRRDSDGAYKNC